jgi:chlorobactene glucosyltransferase
MMAGLLLISFILGTLAIFVLTASLNTLTFPRLNQFYPAAKPEISGVSILIPARNESPRITNTLLSILRQTYPDFELLVLDDQSTDNTLQIVQETAQGDSRLRVLHGEPLPVGWLGKNWACQQLANQAKGEILIFTDADVGWAEDALAKLLAAQTRLDADLLTIWPTQQTVTWSERLVVPMMTFSILAYLPLLAVHHLPWSAFAAANGQCLVFRKSAYQRIGEHAAVHDSIIEDVSLARKIKQHGLHLRMADGANVIKCRMYQGWQEVLHGYAKNILAGHGNKPLFLLLSAIFHWLIFIFPWLWLTFGWLNPAWPTLHLSGWPITPLILVLLGVGVRLLSAAIAKQRKIDALLLPVSVFLMTIIAGQALWWRYKHGGPRWKDRQVAPSHPPV